MNRHDHPDTDLTDPHGEAEALRRENEALAAWACLFMDGTGLTHDAWGNTVCRKSIEAEALRKENARLRRWNKRLRAALAASRAPDPVVNAGSCQPGDLISRAAAIEAATARYRDNGEGCGIIEAIRALPAAPVAEAQPTIGGAELDTLVRKLRTEWPIGPGNRIACQIMGEAAAAITALRAQPDWKAMAERLGEALGDALIVLEEADTAGSQVAADARAALSDLAKMKGE